MRRSKHPSDISFEYPSILAVCVVCEVRTGTLGWGAEKTTHAGVAECWPFGCSEEVECRVYYDKRGELCKEKDENPIEVGAQLATTQSLTSRIGTYDRSDPDNEDTSAKPDPT